VFKNRRTRKSGLPAEATVLSIEDKSGHSTDQLRSFLHRLEVRPDDGAPAFEAKVRDVFVLSGIRPREFDVLRVKYDPKTLNVVFDLEGDWRYDEEASAARSLELRRQMAARRNAARPDARP
jgi:hypothetical protein